MSKFLFILFTALHSLSTAQVLQTWVGIYNGPGNNNDFSRSLVLDDFGNIYVAGGCNVGNGSQYDFVTIKYTGSSSNPQWVRRYNGPDNYNDNAEAITVDTLGNVYVIGTSFTENSYSKVTTLKYNPAGNLCWAAQYSSSNNSFEHGVSVCADKYGNAYVTGTSWLNQTDCLTLKYDSSGALKWVQRYNGPGNTYDEPRSMITDKFANVYITGSSGSSGYPTRFLLIKYNSSGSFQWVQTYSGPANMQDGGYSISVDETGNTYIAGESAGTGTEIDFVTLSYNPSGILRWVKRYNGPANQDDRAFSLSRDRFGNTYVTGRSTGVGSDFDFCTIKYNSEGTQQWVQRYNGPGNSMDIAYSIAVDSLGDVYVTGTSMSSSAISSFDFATIKYNSAGLQKWIQRYNGTGSSEDIAWAVAVDGAGNVYVNGESYGINSGTDITTIKYSQPFGIKRISYNIPKQFNLLQNYPNPFNPSTKIRFDIPSLVRRGAGVVVLKIYDILGREIATLVNEALQPGTYEVEWNASNIPSGVYCYVLSIGEFINTKRMVLIK